MGISRPQRARLDAEEVGKNKRGENQRKSPNVHRTYAKTCDETIRLWRDPLAPKRGGISASDYSCARNWTLSCRSTYQSLHNLVYDRHWPCVALKANSGIPRMGSGDPWAGYLIEIVAD
ncbi:hypothetical protein AAMO2058_001328400 [Amorphochlora amoebiformis]